MGSGDAQHPVHVGALPPDVHGHDDLGAFGDGGLKLARVEVKAVGLDVDEHGPRPDGEGSRRSCDERVRGGYHFVAEPHAQRP